MQGAGRAAGSVQLGGRLLPLLQQVRPNPFIRTRCQDGKILSRLWIKVEPWSWAGDCQARPYLSRSSEGRDLLRCGGLLWDIVDHQGVRYNLWSLCKDEPLVFAWPKRMYFLDYDVCDSKNDSKNSPTLCPSVSAKLFLCDRTLASIFPWWLIGHIFVFLAYAIAAAFNSFEIHVLVQRLLWRGRKSYLWFAMQTPHVQKLKRLEEIVTLNDRRSTDKYRAFCSII